MKILINRTDGIGDTIYTMPMAQMIKKSFPESHIIFLVSSNVAELVRYNKYIDEVWILDTKKTIAKRAIFLFKKFKENNLDAYFYVGGDHLVSFIAWLWRVKFRGGLKSKWQTFFFLNKGIRQYRSMVEMHELEYNIGLLSPWKIEYDFQNKKMLKLNLDLPSEEVGKSFQNFSLTVKNSTVEWRDEIIFIHPGMKGHTLNWPTKNYARLIARLDKIYPDRFLYVISYTSDDQLYLKEVIQQLDKKKNEQLKRKIYFFDGAKEGLGNYIHVLSKAKLFIGPSTGTTHIANLLGINVVAIYSPIKVQSVMRWGPINDSAGKIKTVVPEVICGEQFKCAGLICPYYECMEKIEIEKVLNYATDLIERNGDKNEWQDDDTRTV